MSVSQNPGLKYKHENFKALKDEIDNIIRTCLLGVIYNEEHLMYCGV